MILLFISWFLRRRILLLNQLLPGSSLVAQDASNKLTGAGVGGERGN